MINGNPFIVEWNDSTQELAVDKVNDNPATGTTEIPRRLPFSTAHPVKATVLEPFYMNSTNELGFLLYFASAGFDVNPNTIFWGYSQNSGQNQFRNMYQTNWTTDWSIIKPFYLNGRTYLFFYKVPFLSGKGTAVIDRVADNGAGSTEVWRTDGWANDWEVFEPFYEAGNAYILEVKKGTSVCAIDQVNANGEGTTEIARFDGPGWVSAIVKIFYNGLRPYVLLYSKTYGNWRVYEIRYNDLKGMTLLSEGQWGKVGSIWQNITPFYMNGGIYFFACNYAFSLIPSASAVAIAQFNPDNNTITQIWSSEWKTGWSQLKAFYLPPTPYPPVVPASAG